MKIEDIRVINIKMVNKGAYVASCDVQIFLFDSESKIIEMQLLDVHYFENGANFWCNLPQKSWKVDDKWRCKNLVKFADEDIKKLIASAIKGAIEASELPPF